MTSNSIEDDALSYLNKHCAIVTHTLNDGWWSVTVDFISSKHTLFDCYCRKVSTIVVNLK